jgi:glycosyltransferase involved in cell wall biosynthesis
MKVIAHLTASPCLGGPERQMLQLGEELASAYHSVYWTFREEERCWDFVRYANRLGVHAIALRYDTPNLVAVYEELKELLANERPSVLVCHGYKANLLGLLSAKKAGVPALAVSRGWTGESRSVRVFEALDRRVLRWMNHVVCVSHAQAEKVRRAGVVKQNISVIHNAISMERFSHPKPEYHNRLCRMFSTPPQRIVGSAGRLSPEKGFDVFVNAAAEVARSNPQVGFVLFGEGRLHQSLAHQISRNGLKDKFVMAGFHADVDQYLPYLDLFVLPSYTEGLPNVVLEAFAAGVPVIATAVGGTPEIIEDGVNGRLTAPGDAKTLAQRIIELISKDKQRREMGLQGLRRVERHFTFPRQAQEYKDLITRMIAQPSL